MRELKFRAWDTEYDAMYTRVFFNHWMIWIPYDGEDGEEENATPPEKDRQKYDLIGGIWYYCTRVKDMRIMQYTGLKDMNGKEIYEGDILNHLGEFGPNLVVDFDQGIYHLVYANLPEHNNYYSDLNKLVHNHAVVGNIYENPEMVNQ